MSNITKCRSVEVGTRETGEKGRMVLRTRWMGRGRWMNERSASETGAREQLMRKFELGGGTAICQMWRKEAEPKKAWVSGEPSLAVLGIATNARIMYQRLPASQTASCAEYFASRAL